MAAATVASHPQLLRRIFTATLPHSVEAEQGVLGSMLISPREIIAECVEKINEEYFYVPAHQTIYSDPGRSLECRRRAST